MLDPLFLKICLELAALFRVVSPLDIIVDIFRCQDCEFFPQSKNLLVVLVRLIRTVFLSRSSLRSLSKDSLLLSLGTSRDCTLASAAVSADPPIEIFTMAQPIRHDSGGNWKQLAQCTGRGRRALLIMALHSLAPNSS